MLDTGEKSSERGDEQESENGGARTPPHEASPADGTSVQERKLAASDECESPTPTPNMSPKDNSDDVVLAVVGVVTDVVGDTSSWSCSRSKCWCSCCCWDSERVLTLLEEELRLKLHMRSAAEVAVVLDGIDSQLRLVSIGWSAWSAADSEKNSSSDGYGKCALAWGAGSNW